MFFVWSYFNGTPMRLSGVLLVVAMMLIVFVWFQGLSQDVEMVRSKLDGRNYVVQRLPNAQQAADILARLNRDALVVMERLRREHPGDAAVQRLVDRFRPDALSEGRPGTELTSYNVAKGRKIVMCIRQSDLSFVDHNTLVYVMFHELAHIMTVSVGHKPEFWRNFKWILQEAVQAGLYRRVDYASKPQDFCGIKIASTVL